MILNREKLQHGLFGHPVLHGPDKTLEIVGKGILTILDHESLTSYPNMKSAYGWIISRYWTEIDGLKFGKRGLDGISVEPITRDEFTEFMRKRATSSEDIMRALRWLRQENYVIMDKNVTEAAQLAAAEMKRARTRK